MNKSTRFYMVGAVLCLLPLVSDILGFESSDIGTGFVSLAGILFFCTGNILEALNK